MRKLLTALCLLAVSWLWPVLPVVASDPATAQEAAPPLDDYLENDGIRVAAVELDGLPLFRVRGVAAMPASERAKRIHRRIVELAENPAIDPRTVSGRVEDDRISFEAGGEHVFSLLSIDAALEQVPLQLLAEATQPRLVRAVEQYRKARSPRSLLRSTGILVGVTLAAALLLYAVNALFGWINRLIERLVKRRIERIERASHRVIDAAQLWSWFGGVMRGVRTLVVLATVLAWLNTALGLYPWTRPFASDVFRLVLDPLRDMGMAVVESLPDIAFLVVLVLVVRFVLHATHTFFERIDRGWIRLANFEREWALPTYRIVRILIVAFALVVAYPYIPGSDSDAFKGVSIFLGVVFSIGSSSFVANMIAGYSLTYRGAFREGERVRIGDHLGDIVAVRALSTTMNSLKNEEINIPNSEVLASTVVNYSTDRREEGIILHTEVGIGYDTPWRQVEALLLLAAERTQGLESSPEPFVLQTAMGDFAVTYQLNAHCRDAARMMAIYSELHGHIQDVFNEHGVQIMSPHYESDPEVPKLVPTGQWYTAPARPPES